MANTVSAALVPEMWPARIQRNLTKSLVSLETCDTTLKADLKYGDNLHFPYIAAIADTPYVPGEAIAMQDFTATDDTIDVTTFKVCPFYVRYLRTLGESLSIKLRKLRETLFETIRSEAQKWERSTTIIGVSCPLTI